MYGGPYGGRRVDVTGDGIPDIKVGPYGQVRPDVGTYVHGPQMYPPAYGGMPYGGMPYGGARVDVNGDGIPDVRVGPYGQTSPDVGSYVPPYGAPPYYGPRY